MLELLALGGLLAWTLMSYQQTTVPATGPAKAVTTTERLKGLVDNGYQFRDVMFSTMADWLGHPDVRNNFFGHGSAQRAIHDAGVYGTHRQTAQLYEGISEPVQLSRTDSMVL